MRRARLGREKAKSASLIGIAGAAHVDQLRPRGCRPGFDAHAEQRVTGSGMVERLQHLSQPVGQPRHLAPAAGQQDAADLSPVGRLRPVVVDRAAALR